jgi:putative flippase GtrA
LTLPSLLLRLWRDKQSQALMARYLVIGGLVFCLDVGSFKLLLLAFHYRPSTSGSLLALAVATVCSYCIAVSAHFTLNRAFNFRSFDRTFVQQARTYLVIVFLSALLTVGIVQFGVRMFGVDPVLAKIFAIALNVPVGFFGHRYLTFGAGIGATYRRLRAAGTSGERMP